MSITLQSLNNIKSRYSVNTAPCCTLYLRNKHMEPAKLHCYELATTKARKYRPQNWQFPNAIETAYFFAACKNPAKTVSYQFKCLRQLRSRIWQHFRLARKPDHRKRLQNHLPLQPNWRQSRLQKNLLWRQNTVQVQAVLYHTFETTAMEPYCRARKWSYRSDESPLNHGHLLQSIP